MCARWCGRDTETQQATAIRCRKQSCNEGTNQTQVRFQQLELAGGSNAILQF
jgi:hypothetical protein